MVKVENLKEAYPNYFLDVHLFTQWIKHTVLGKVPPEYVPAPSTKGIDLKWVADRENWRPTRR